MVLADADTIAAWPVRPVIAISHTPAPPYAWDTAWATWDDPTPLVWDARYASPLRTDATCEWLGLEIAYGPPDDHAAFPAGRLLLQLDNRAGAWSAFNTDGSPALAGPGQSIDVWAHNPSGDWWLFSGVIARWDERADDTVEVEAFDAFSTLAQPVGTYTPGVAGDQPGERMEAVLAATGRTAVPHRFAAGTVALTAQATERAPLEELQVIAGSDGGVIYGDADGTVVAFDRTWRSGRGDAAAVVVSDNVCTAPVVVWDAVLSTNDTYLADTVVLENVEGLRAQTPAVLTGLVLAESDQQWTTQGEGDILAGVLLAAQTQPRVALDTFDVYLLDPHQPELWRAVDWRLFDPLRFLHDSRAVGGTARLDVTALVTSVVHAITPDGWVMTVGTSRAQSYLAPYVWDTPIITWDDPAPDAVWNY